MTMAILIASTYSHSGVRSWVRCADAALWSGLTRGPIQKDMPVPHYLIPDSAAFGRRLYRSRPVTVE